MQSKKELQKRIRYLQRILVEMSFAKRNDRPELYVSVMNSLHTTQQLLLDNKSLNRGI